LLAVNFLLLARFYKWYYWLFPLLSLLLLVALTPPWPQVARPAAGAVLRHGVLYRTDLGIGCLGLGAGRDVCSCAGGNRTAPARASVG